MPFTPEFPINPDILSLREAIFHMNHFDGVLEDPSLLGEFNRLMKVATNLQSNNPALGLFDVPQVPQVSTLISSGKSSSPTGMLGTDPDVANQFFHRVVTNLPAVSHET
jgi:hypothetical protein